MTSSESAHLELDRFGAAGPALLRTLRSGRISPSYLFEGEDPDDLSEAALAFASALLTVGRDDGPRVARLVLDGQHPDLHRQTKDKATVISVAALTALLERSHQTPLEGRWQVFLIEPAEAMEAEGIAKYLKALEEPPPGTVFLLASTYPDRLPETVLSRVRRVRIPPIATDVLAARLRADGVDAGDAADLARWGGGSTARATRLRELEAGDLVRALVSAATSRSGMATTVERVRRAVEREATRRVEADVGHDRKQEMRVLLQDLVHVLAVEARDRAASRPSALLGSMQPHDALRTLEHLGRLSAGVGRNVTPAVVLLDIVRCLSGV